MLSAFLTFFGCSKVQESDVTETTAQNSTSDEITQPATEKRHSPNGLYVPKDYPEDVAWDGDKNNCVYTFEEHQFPFNGDFHITGETGFKGEDAVNRIPQLYMICDDAQTINRFIYDHFHHELRSEREANNDPTLQYKNRVDYVANVNGNVLSLAVEESPGTEMLAHLYAVYNIDLESGKQLNDEEVASLAGLTLEQAHDMVNTEIEAKLSQEEKKVKDKDKLAEEIENKRNKSSSEDNLARTKFYFDKDGKLVAVYGYYTLAGQGYKRAVCVLDASFEQVQG